MGDAQPENPCSDWMPENKWDELNRLNKLPKFKGFLDDFIKDHAFYKGMYDSSAPQEFELKEPWLSKLDKF